MEFNKRGQGLSVNAIILIVLGVVVLAVLIAGFALGWKNIAPWLGGGNNVDTLVTTCGVACSTNSQFDFCIAKKDLKAGDDSIKDVTCNYLAEKQKKYGVASCASISCDGVAVLIDPTNTKLKSLNINLGNQEEFSKNGALICGLNDVYRGKILYVLNSGNDTLLSLECGEKTEEAT
ncbi:MAG: hypothetical protein IIA85_03160 [Nanoarchaeota archaeon]|nr:hypothetical protein [Nanoarchaeota archaeon]